MNALVKLLDRWQPRRIVVVGDFMLDHYVFGNAERLSPDAPVPVLAAQPDRDRVLPGGAGNVARMLAALQCRVACAGVLGNDPEGRQLADLLRQDRCDSSALLTADDRPTTVKRSFIGLAQHRHPQKMFRVDYEQTGPLDPALRRQLLEAAAALLEQADLLCLEDYGKGVIHPDLAGPLIDRARRIGLPVLVDPAPLADYAAYRHATLITPNRTEAERATGFKLDSDQALEQAAQYLLESLELDAVVLTLDRHGALLARRGHRPQRFPTTARSVYDVTGAGDMVLAALASALANGADLPDALQLANLAAGLEVERFGVCPIELAELHLAVLQAHHATLGKVRTLEQLLPELAAHRRQGRKIAFTNGCFDILHAGHVSLLRQARQTADLLVLAVNTDASISALKGPDRPIISQNDRVTVLSELQCVDYIILFGDGSGGPADTPADLIRAIRPDVLVKGGDYSIDRIVGHDIVQQSGGKVLTIPLVEGRSTSEILARIRRSD